MSARPIGMYRGVVRRVTTVGAWVHVPHLNGRPDHAYGPLQHLELPATPALTTDSAGDPAHTHDIEPTAVQLEPGDQVLVSFVEGRPDDLVILGRLRP